MNRDSNRLDLVKMADETEKLMRSVLQSCKNGVPLKQLDNDYKCVTGDDIPFRKFGFLSLEDYLRKIPKVVKLTNGPNGGTIVEAVPDSSTRHIAELVSRQKSSKTKTKSNKRSCASNSNYRSNRSSNVQYSGASNSHYSGANNSHYSNRSSNGQTSNYQSNRSIYVQPLNYQSNRNYDSQLSASNASSHPSKTNNGQMHNNDSYRRYEAPPRFTKQSQSPTPTSPPATSSRSVTLPSETTNPYVLVTLQSTELRIARTKRPALLPTPPPILPSPRLNLSSPPPSLPSPPPNLPSPPPVLSSPPPILPSPPPTSIYSDTWKNVPPKVMENGDVSNRREEAHRSVRDRLSSYREMLEQYVQINKLPVPIFSLMPLPEIGGHMASVKVAEQMFSSYPIENLSPDQAREIASKKAIEGLAARKDIDQSTVSTEVDVLFSRIEKLLQNYRCGVVSDEIPSRYKEEYQENLPEGWLKIIMKRNIINFETHNDRIILYPEIPKDTATGLDKNGVGDPKVEFVDVYLCHAVSTTSVFVRLVETSEAFEALGIKMEDEYMHYRSNIATCDIIVGKQYAAHFASAWHRVTVMSLHKNKVLCKFIDNGDYDYVNSTSIQPLKPEFLELTDQALEYQLYGLEEYAEHPTSLLALQTECGNTFVAEVKPRGKFNALVLYDTSHGDNPENVNDKIMSRILETDITPALPNTGIVCDKPVYLSHVLSNGDIFVQIQNECYSFVEQLLLEIRGNCDEIPSVTVENVRLGEANYIAKYEGEWYRARVDNFDGDQIKVFFIDFGNSETVSIENIKNLLPVDEILPKLPPLAFHCKLFGVPRSADLEWNQAAVAKLSELALDEHVLLKVVIPATSQTFPSVEIFKRLQPDNQLIAIKETLTIDEDLFWPKITGCNSSSPHSEINLNLNILQPPQLPSVGSYINVQVSLTASPCNFRCQLYDTYMSLELLTLGMQSHYENKENLVTMEAKSVKIGRYYACKHLEDKLWYRVQVKGYDANISVMSLYYIDFGDTVVATLNEIQPLINSFRTLPYQAVICKLHGVSPINKDWRPEDCIRFQNLVENKKFVAEVCGKYTDDEMLTLEVKLIDTSSENVDVDIGKVLIEEGCALAIV